MNIDRQQITEVVYAAIDEANAAQAGRFGPIEKAGTTVLFGRTGAFDSLGLVHFVVSVEEGVSDVFDANISLVTDEAMARERSPFRTVDTIVDFIAELLEAQPRD
jgi:acyl carrier protein